MITQVSKIYANSFADVSDNLQKSLDELQKISEIFNSNPRFFDILSAPTVEVEKKILLIEDVFKNEISLKTLNFLKLITEKNHLKNFSEIIEAFVQRQNSIEKTKNVEIISAIELKSEYKEKIVAKLSQKLNSTINPNWRINPDIIGGLIVKFDDTVADSSVKTKLENIYKGNL